MATLDNKSIRESVSGAVRYINNPGKNIPPDGLARASAYIRGEHSVERLYSRGHNGCSPNPDVAIQQFRACEQLYRQKKAGAREAGLADGKQPIVAEHFFLSFPPHENVPYDTQCEIVDKLCASETLKDFYCTSNRHWNTDNDHSHILACNTSKDGSRKLGMNNKKRNALRKELDRICVSYGLSVIDDPGLRHNDPEREDFIRSLVEEGKVEVYVPADYRKLLSPEREYDRWMLAQIQAGKVRVAEGVSKNRECTQAEAYERWIAEQPYFRREKDKKAAKEKKYALIPEGASDKASRVYYWDEQYKSSKHKGYYYAVRLYDDDGRRKPLLVLLIELVLLAAHHEEEYFRYKYPNNTVFSGKPSYKMQMRYDVFRYQEEQGVRDLSELYDRIEAVGSDLAEARKGLAYYQRAIEKGDDLHKAILIFNTMERRKKERPLTDEEQMVFNEAYRIMAAHKCTEPLQIGEFFDRWLFAEKKVKDLDEQIKKLKKDYHDLKYIDAHYCECRYDVEKYTYQNADSHSLEDLVNHANAQKTAQQSYSRENEKIF